MGECGHAWRVAYSYWNTLAGIGSGGKDPFALKLQGQLDHNYRQPMHICELTWDLVQNAAPSCSTARPTTTAWSPSTIPATSRAPPGWATSPAGSSRFPRALIRAVANRYVEMRGGTTHEETFCCGGGGGLLTDEILELRVKGALPRMEALREAADRHGVNFMATICAICKAQFTKVLPYYGFDRGMVGGIHQLVSTAIRLGAKQ